MPVFEELFVKSKGQPVTYEGGTIQLMDEIPLSSGRFTLEFMSTSSPFRQGIELRTSGAFRINDQVIERAMVLWADTAPKVVSFSVTATDSRLSVWNVWDFGNGTTQAWHNGAAMRVEHVDPSARIYRCNDGQPNDDFKDLVFKLCQATA